MTGSKLTDNEILDAYQVWGYTAEEASELLLKSYRWLNNVTKCRGCEYKRPIGCARSNYDKTGITYYHESGMMGMLTSEGFIYSLVDIDRCDKWSEK